MSDKLKKASSDKVNINVDKDVKRLEIWEGDLPAVKQSNRVTINGSIKAVSEFATKRKAKFNALVAHILFSYEDRFIRLETNERFKEKGYTVLGKLEFSDELGKLDILTSADKDPDTYDAKKLAQKIRFNRALFANSEECDRLLESISKLKVKVEQEYEQHLNDNRGNKAASYTQSVDAKNVPLEFTMRCPVFKGYDAAKFKVLVCFDVRDRNIDFWFESAELAEIIQIQQKTIIDEQLKIVSEYVQIEQ